MTEITGIKLSLVSVPLDGLDANTLQASKIKGITLECRSPVTVAAIL